MKKVILAGLRKSRRERRVPVAFVAFLCFFSVVYINRLRRGKTYEDDLIMQLHCQNVIVSTRRGDLMCTLQNMPIEKENPNQREGAYGWCSVTSNVSSWTYLRQAPEYFDQHDTNTYAMRRVETLLALMDRGYYYDELEGYGITEKALEMDRAYYRYFETQDVPPYIAPYEPNLSDFILQIFQHNTMLLLIVVASLLMVNQICHDYDSDTCKAIYSQPISRKKLIIAKVSAVATVIPLTLPAALAVFSVVPLSAYGMGSSAYPYIVHTYDVVSWTWLLQRILPFSLPVILSCMAVAALLASWQKAISDTILRTGSLLILIYLLIHIFGYSIPLFSWIPFFYTYPIEVAAYDLTLDLLLYIILCIAGSLVFSLLHIFITERRGLEDGVRL